MYYKITCRSKGNREFLIVIRAVLAVDTCFLVEAEADWSPIGGDCISQRLDQCLAQKNEDGSDPVPILQNYGHQVLAAFTKKQLHMALNKAKQIRISRNGPQLQLDTLIVWRRIKKRNRWVQIKKIST